MNVCRLEVLPLSEWKEHVIERLHESNEAAWGRGDGEKGRGGTNLNSPFLPSHSVHIAQGPFCISAPKKGHY